MSETSFIGATAIGSYTHNSDTISYTTGNTTENNTICSYGIGDDMGLAPCPVPLNVAPFSEELPDCIIVRKGPDTYDKWYTEVTCPKCDSILLTRCTTEISNESTRFWCVICDEYQTYTSKAIKKYNPMLIRAPSYQTGCSVM